VLGLVANGIKGEVAAGDTLESSKQASALALQKQFESFFTIASGIEVE